MCGRKLLVNDAEVIRLRGRFALEFGSYVAQCFARLYSAPYPRIRSMMVCITNEVSRRPQPEIPVLPVQLTETNEG